jgi:hypothetical protein
MNLRDIYEKDEKEEDAVDIRDPATRWLIKKARARYAYAETDLEAFVKFMQDEVQAEKANIQSNTDGIEANTDGIEHEAEVNVSQQQEIDKTEKSAQKSKEVNITQERHLARLDAKEKELDNKIAHFDKAEKRMDMMIDKFDKATLRNNGTVQIGN